MNGVASDGVGIWITNAFDGIPRLRTARMRRFYCIPSVLVSGRCFTGRITPTIVCTWKARLRE